MEEVELDTWLSELSGDQLREQAARRQLSTGGSKAVLRARILRYEEERKSMTVKAIPPPSPALDASAVVDGESVEAFEGNGRNRNLDMTRDETVEHLDMTKQPNSELRPGMLPSREVPSYEAQGAIPKRNNYDAPRRLQQDFGIPPHELNKMEQNVPSASYRTFGYVGNNADYHHMPPMREAQIPWSEGSASRASRPPGAVSASEVWNTMRRWNLNFTGARGTDPEAFIRKIENGRAIIPMSDEDILRCLPFFFSGIADYWFQAKRESFRSWQEFKIVFRQRFTDPDYQFALREEINRRTQGENEPVADFITCMMGLFSRLVPAWSVKEQLDYTHRNMLPRLQVAVHRDDFIELDGLELLARRVERSYAAAQYYRAPPLPENSLCPDLAYRPPPRPSRTAVVMTANNIIAPGVQQRPREEYHRDSVPRTRPAAPVQSPSPATRPRESRESERRREDTTRQRASGTQTKESISTRDSKCWNCGAEGHLARGCLAPRRMHCYRCGRPDVTLKNCQSCAGNGRRGA